MPRFEGNLQGYLEAFLDAHPDWNTVQHQFTTDQPGAEGEWISVDLVRTATRWARQRRYISWEMATSMETLCRRVDNHLSAEDADYRREAQ